LNFDRLTDTARKAALAAGLRPPCRNMFRSIIVRAVEILWAVEEALRIVRSYEPPPAPHVDLSPRAATGRAATEAPRGILYHRYRLDAEGLIEDAKIVPPTSQNQLSIESDLMELGPKLVEMPHAEAVWTAEQAIRNYDPCISCATHFLALEVVRE
jgi:coenzyme F420-reducing hydrogenase alpha subunit